MKVILSLLLTSHLFAQGPDNFNKNNELNYKPSNSKFFIPRFIDRQQINDLWINPDFLVYMKSKITEIDMNILKTNLGSSSVININNGFAVASGCRDSSCLNNKAFIAINIDDGSIIYGYFAEQYYLKLNKFDNLNLLPENVNTEIDNLISKFMENTGYHPTWQKDGWGNSEDLKITEILPKSYKLYELRKTKYVDYRVLNALIRNFRIKIIDSNSTNLAAKKILDLTLEQELAKLGVVSEPEWINPNQLINDKNVELNILLSNIKDNNLYFSSDFKTEFLKQIKQLESGSIESSKTIHTKNNNTQLLYQAILRTLGRAKKLIPPKIKAKSINVKQSGRSHVS